MDGKLETYKASLHEFSRMIIVIIQYNVLVCSRNKALISNFEECIKA